MKDRLIIVGFCFIGINMFSMDADPAPESARLRWIRSYALYKQLPIENYDGRIRTEVAISSGGLIATSNASIAIWDSEQETPRCSFAPLGGDTYRGVLSFLSENVIAEGNEKRLDLWDIERKTWTERRSFYGLQRSRYITRVNNKCCVTISKIFKSALDASSSRYSTRCKRTPNKFEKSFFDDDFHADTVVVWHLDETKHSILGTWVRSCAFSPDGNTLAVGAKGAVELYDLRKLRNPWMSWETGYGFDVEAVAFLTSTTVAAEDCGNLALLDSTSNVEAPRAQKFKIPCYAIKTIQPINSTMLGLAGYWTIGNQLAGYNIFDVQRGSAEEVRTIHGSISSKSGSYPLVRGPSSTLATLSWNLKNGYVMLHRPESPEVPRE